MSLEEELLKKAREAGSHLAEAERQAMLARAEYHTAIRRLHLAGGSLREIARTFALSHQRVQQIVEVAGGSWWQRVWRTRNAKRDAVCTFCERPPSEVAKLIAGPNVYICDACVALAEEAMSRGPRGSGSSSQIRAGARCSFCGKRRSAGKQLFRMRAANVCGDCLRTCREILDHSAA